jgi:energy-coupling factor transporter transmembrane protein EcfT
LPKLIKEIRDYIYRSSLRYALESMWTLLTAALLTFTNALPEGRFRRAITTWVTVVIILVIIVAGAAVLLIIVIMPGGTSTTTVYP